MDASTSILPAPHQLDQRHVEGAKLFANRQAMIKGLGIPVDGVIAEVGVALGDFSEFLIDTLKPRTFVAMDLWQLHEHQTVWGRPAAEVFGGLTQAQFFEERFRDRGDLIRLESGESAESLWRQADESFDMIYVDAGHDYENARKDAEAALAKIKRDGTIIFNDYIMYDHLAHSSYGVVHVVNQLVVEQGWSVVGFALAPQMFCDIALRRKI
ncbi:class I SAM-dependent methyltransferase [Acidisoma cellulosilytica]|uniref:Class I SAM-dependent methyltransferase n=1 Tax=Acidisoma cellulosilyticum TaxID=2802395 RepID=A0A963Z0J5_9PROT|nr:class I SAM-dependent methyltransferase [Acidisoma cellulosilyticum]MCB8880465.1 class I SAM-dependent methyltransferase [Acidisoma cellulosilyticum]